MPLFLLGLAIGVIIAAMAEALVIRLFVIALAAVGIWALNNDVGLTSSIMDDDATTKNADVTLENVKLSRPGYGL